MTGTYWGNVFGCIYANLGQAEGSPFVEINGGSSIRAVATAANGEYIVGGGDGPLGVWRVEDGKRIATVGAAVWSLAVSEDDRWIAAGTSPGEVFEPQRHGYHG